METTKYGIIDEKWLGLAERKRRKGGGVRWVVKEKEKIINYGSYYYLSADSVEEYLNKLEANGMLVRNCEVI